MLIHKFALVSVQAVDLFVKSTHISNINLDGEFIRREVHNVARRGYSQHIRRGCGEFGYLLRDQTTREQDRELSRVEIVPWL